MTSDLDYISIKKNPGEFFDWTTFLLTVLLVAAGLISIYSATYDSGMSSFFTRQLAYASIGIVIMFAIMFIPEKWIFASSFILYGATLLSLILVLIIGKEVNGTKGWIYLAGFSIQPSEFAKVTTLLVVARHLSMKGSDIRTFRDLGVVFGLILLPMILIFLQPDHGTTTVFGAMFLGVIFWAGFDIFILYIVVCTPLIIILSLMGPAIFVTSVSIFSIIADFFRRKIIPTIVGILIFVVIGYSSSTLINRLEPYQRDRIETFMNPGKNPKGKGYNVIQSMLAVGSGGLAGKGFLAGTQTQLRYIPEQWTDFIFSVPAEEFGFIGSSLVILLLSGLIFRSIKIASESDSSFFSVISVGIGTVFLYHMIINIGMAIGIVPVMGLPLPFLSSGGSFLISNMMMVGLLLNSYRSHRRKMRAI